ncbi:MAG: sugar O-acyltransferase (sialic acid O-acetyltransferase NeuD family) [Parvicella sp.]|jgi:sugar O-acyltransferase (sialic acid O-acetyltransferase NeuD family)
MSKVVLIGYSGHGYVICEALLLLGIDIAGYAALKENELNPYDLKYLGDESHSNFYKNPDLNRFFVAVGDNSKRAKIFSTLQGIGKSLLTVVHPDARLSKYSSVGLGTYIARGTNVNSQVAVGDAVILNTGCCVDHECEIDSFAHIAPGSVLAGNVKVGLGTFIGANSTVKQGVKIGRNCIIGAGSVVLNDIEDNETWVGNPARRIK